MESDKARRAGLKLDEKMPTRLFVVVSFSISLCLLTAHFLATIFLSIPPVCLGERTSAGCRHSMKRSERKARTGKCCKLTWARSFVFRCPFWSFFSFCLRSFSTFFWSLFSSRQLLYKSRTRLHCAHTDSHPVSLSDVHIRLSLPLSSLGILRIFSVSLFRLSLYLSHTLLLFLSHTPCSSFSRFTFSQTSVLSCASSCFPHDLISDLPSLLSFWHLLSTSRTAVLRAQLHSSHFFYNGTSI